MSEELIGTEIINEEIIYKYFPELTPAQKEQFKDRKSVV